MDILPDPKPSDITPQLSNDGNQAGYYPINIQGP